jgi:hypothetical protein
MGLRRRIRNVVDQEQEVLAIQEAVAEHLKEGNC